MRHIPILGDIIAKTMSGEVVIQDGAPLVFNQREFIEGRLSDPQMGQSVEWLFAAFEILNRLREVKEGDRFLSIESDHWEKLKTVTIKPAPQTPYNPQAAFNLVPYIKAILDAADSIEEPPESNEPPS